MSLKLDELAIHIPASIQLFEQYGLDYYQKGSQTLREACESAELSFAELDKALAQLQDVTLTLEDMSADRLIDYLNGHYHAGERELLNSIYASIRQLIQTSEGEPLQKLLRIEPVFRQLMTLLTAHCEKEDAFFFPWMRKLTALHRHKAMQSMPVIIGFIRNPLHLLESDHQEIIDLLVVIKKTVDNFLPGYGTADYMQLMQDLKTFETELHMHMHIENNILFTKLLKLEEALIKQLNL
jgi:regulator of cell morphogenesis and NO signaling